MKIHFIIITKDLKEDYFAEASISNNEITFKKNNVTTTFIIDEYVTIIRKGEMYYKQEFKLNELTKGIYEIMNLNINIKAYTKVIRYNKSGLFLEYDQYIDDVLNDKIKVYLKY